MGYRGALLALVFASALTGSVRATETVSDPALTPDKVGAPAASTAAAPVAARDEFAVDFAALLDKEKLVCFAEKTFENESGGHGKNIMQWNRGEGFLSLGLGHFLWAPSDRAARRFGESFKQFVVYYQQQPEPKPPLPASCLPGLHCPFANKAEFERERDSAMGVRAREIRDFLEQTRLYQARFMRDRLVKATDLILSHLKPEVSDRVRKAIFYLSNDDASLFAMMDYVNFKGEGIGNGKISPVSGWGLSQVLQCLVSKAGAKITADTMTPLAFADAADETLKKRKDVNKTTHLGWTRRIRDTYLNAPKCEPPLRDPNDD